MKTMESKYPHKYPLGLCEWCGKPLTMSVIMQIEDDTICPNCYWGYRKDKERVKALRKGVVSHG